MKFKPSVVYKTSCRLAQATQKDKTKQKILRKDRRKSSFVKFTYFCVTLDLFCVGACTHHRTHVEVRGQRLGVGSFL